MKPSPIRRRIVAALALVAIALLASACASPPQTLYTLEAAAAPAAPASPSAGKLRVVEIRRAIVPDYLDNQDILVRNGSTLARSSRGRWASRLSLGATHLVATQLALRRPDLLITDQPQVEPPDYQVFLTISRLDVTADGSATLDADWLIVPRAPGSSSQRHRGQFSTTGSVATDRDVVSLNRSLLDQLGQAIAASSPW
jgi:hypothetical protein